MAYLDPVRHRFHDELCSSAELAFSGKRAILIDEAKIGILGGSIVSAIVGYAALRLTTRHRADECDEGPKEPT